jgi:hypothetical protein
MYHIGSWGLWKCSITVLMPDFRDSMPQLSLSNYYIRRRESSMLMRLFYHWILIGKVDGWSKASRTKQHCQQDHMPSTWLLASVTMVISSTLSIKVLLIVTPSSYSLLSYVSTYILSIRDGGETLWSCLTMLHTIELSQSRQSLINWRCQSCI